jgi:hypothetical protein
MTASKGCKTLADLPKQACRGKRGEYQLQIINPGRTPLLRFCWEKRGDNK